MENRFNFLDFIKVFALAILLFAGFSTAIDLIPEADVFMQSFHPSVSFLFTYLIQLVIFFFPLWLFVINKYDIKFSEFGFRKVSAKKLILTVILTYVAYLAFTLFVSTFIFSNGLEVPGYQQQESYVPIFGSDPIGLTVAILVVVFLAPLLEEFFFRGFIYQVLRKTWSPVVGSILTALIFSLIHFQLSSMLAIFVLGLLLNYVFERTKSLWTAIAFHSLNNAVAFSLDIYLYFHPDVVEKLVKATAFLY